MTGAQAIVQSLKQYGVNMVFGLPGVQLDLLPEIMSFTKDYLPSAIKTVSSLQAAVYGIILMLFVILQPTGFYGLWVKIRNWWRMFPL